MNVAGLITEAAKRHPEKRSVVFSKLEENRYEYSAYTFQEFEERSNRFAHALLERGVRRGDRVLLFVKPCLDFSVLTFSLFKIGALPVLIDPGMGMKSLLRSVKQVRPRVLLGVPEAFWLKWLRSSSFTSVEVSLSLGPSLFAHDLFKDLSRYPSEFQTVTVSTEEPAAILFTSGGTGIPKGVVYTHGIFRFQTEALKSMFSLHEGDVDLPGFPLFALFTLGMGMTSVIPDMNPARPSSVDPRKIVRNILDQQVSFVAGSPAIWQKVGEYCLRNRISLPSVKRVVMFGAPVRTEIHEMFQRLLPNGDTYTPYGATECLPVSLISGKEILRHHRDKTLRGEGICIGREAPRTVIKIISSSDIPQGTLSELPEKEVGEIVVHGPQVTPFYFEMDEETKKAKIPTASGLWHRMGDVGYKDQEGLLWFLGRKSHVVSHERRSLYPIREEAFFNRLPGVKKSALIDLGDGAGIVLEAGPVDLPETLPPAIKKIFITEKLPVDVRHNIKIDRSLLGRWARTNSRKLKLIFLRD